jgi:hypothetical protein
MSVDLARANSACHSNDRDRKVEKHPRSGRRSAPSDDESTTSDCFYAFDGMSVSVESTLFFDDKQFSTQSSCRIRMTTFHNAPICSHDALNELNFLDVGECNRANNACTLQVQTPVSQFQTNIYRKKDMSDRSTLDIIAHIGNCKGATAIIQSSSNCASCRRIAGAITRNRSLLPLSNASVNTVLP